MSVVQHQAAQKVLALIRAAVPEHRLLTYQTVAAELGRDPNTSSRAIAQVCDLLDAAAAHAQVPALALVVVRNASGQINPMAWKRDSPPGLREAIIERSLAHRFNDSDFAAIERALMDLDGLGNRAAWKKVFGSRPLEQLYKSLADGGPASTEDAINDLGTDEAIGDEVTGIRYRRDPQVRRAVEVRAQGSCEYCNEIGFARPDGSRYLETHHIISLASEGADRVSNVIALCPGHHKEAHFGANRTSLEREFVEVLRRKKCLP